MKILALQIFIFFSVLPSNAEFMPVDTKDVPAGRVLTNLTTQLRKNSNDFNVVHAIARMHSLSYANAASNWIVKVQKKSDLPFHGYGPETPPSKIYSTTNPITNLKAQSHLTNAIYFYKRASELAPTNFIVHMSLGWCLLQNHQNNAALPHLRRAVELSWAHTQKSKHIMWDTTEEAISYLLPLLDPNTDRTEIANLSEIKKSAQRMGRVITPLIVPLEVNIPLASLIDTNASVAFDLDGSAQRDRRWTWITPRAAWLIYQPQREPATSGLQLFGNVTFWVFWQNGFHALASLDDNSDGQIAGEELRYINLWRDVNSDGRCSADEIMALKDAGIESLNTHYIERNGILQSPDGVSMMNGTTRPIYDVILTKK
jgi:hypothetical protein